MFAPRVATTQTKGDAGSTGRFGQRTLSQARNEPDGDQEREIVGESLTDPAPPRRLAWDFGKIPLFPPDRTSRRQLAPGPVDDPLEQEADRIAHRVMRMQGPAQPGASMQARQAAYEEDKPLQVKTAGTPDSRDEAATTVQETLRSPGHSLDPSTRAIMEPPLRTGLRPSACPRRCRGSSLGEGTPGQRIHRRPRYFFRRRSICAAVARVSTLARPRAHSRGATTWKSPTRPMRPRKLSKQHEPGADWAKIR